MKIKPVILCGGSGTRLWPESKNNPVKQFINFGGWTLFQKTLERVKSPIFDHPIISTNKDYLKSVLKYLTKYKIKKYKVLVEPVKKNTAAAILSGALLDEIPIHQPMIFFPSDHLIKENDKLIKSIVSNRRHLNDNNIFIFGIKPTLPSSQFGYFLSKKTSKGTNKVFKFIEKPTLNYAKKIIKKNGYWNSGIIFASKMSVINNFQNYQTKTLNSCIDAVYKSKFSKNVYYLNKKSFQKIIENSFDYAILEKSREINSINLNITWSDLGSWSEILKIFKNNKSKYFKKTNVFHRPWGKYTNFFNGNGFLIKELFINPKSSISLQKHRHRTEHWSIISGRAIITINKRKFLKKQNDVVFIPRGAVHRIENNFNKPVVIMEAQTGKILKESDIIRYKDIYGRIN